MGLLFAFIGALFFAMPGQALSADVTLVQSEGMAAKSDDIARVKREAMDSALRSAVLDSARNILAAESLSVPDAALEELASAPRAYVLNYRIRSEGWITHMDSVAPASAEASGAERYHIWLDASVDTGALRAALSRLATDEETGPTWQVVINLLGVADYPTFRLLMDSLGKIAFIKELSYGSFASGRITLTAVVAGDLSQLAPRIAREVPEKFAVMEGAGQIIIKPSSI